VVAALHEAFFSGRDLTADDLFRSAMALIPLSKTMSEEIDALRSWAIQRARPAAKETDEKKSV
jgi:hypothetical protein